MRQKDRECLVLFVLTRELFNSQLFFRKQLTKFPYKGQDFSGIGLGIDLLGEFCNPLERRHNGSPQSYSYIGEAPAQISRLFCFCNKTKWELPSVLRVKGNLSQHKRGSV